MKEQMINNLVSFRDAMRTLKKEVKNSPKQTINPKAIRQEADRIATQWVEELRSPLEHKFGLPKEAIYHMAEQMKRLHVLSRPSNLKSSYIKTLNSALSKFDNHFILPIKQGNFGGDDALDIRMLIPNLSDGQESAYWDEAGKCAKFKLYRAAVVMGWCATINRIHDHIWKLGPEKINAAFADMKQEKRGKFKNFTKNLSVSSLSSVQEIADRDLILLIERLGLVDSNQATRIRTHLDHRNQSAHPGQAPIDKDHVKLFFSDIGKIIFDNPKMKR